MFLIAGTARGLVIVENKLLTAEDEAKSCIGLYNSSFQAHVLENWFDETSPTITGFNFARPLVRITLDYADDHIVVTSFSASALIVNLKISKEQNNLCCFIYSSGAGDVPHDRIVPTQLQLPPVLAALLPARLDLSIGHLSTGIHESDLNFQHISLSIVYLLSTAGSEISTQIFPWKGQSLVSTAGLWVQTPLLKVQRRFRESQMYKIRTGIVSLNLVLQRCNQTPDWLHPLYLNQVHVSIVQETRASSAYFRGIHICCCWDAVQVGEGSHSMTTCSQQAVLQKSADHAIHRA
ncbi:hypothetical protein CBL_09042 [Carabus blaptoides fortunei]